MSPWLLPVAAAAAWAGMLCHRLAAAAPPGALLIGAASLALAGLLSARDLRSSPVLVDAGIVDDQPETVAAVAARPRRSGAWQATLALCVGMFLLGAGWSQVRHDAVTRGALASMAPARLEVWGSLRTDPDPTRSGWAATMHVWQVRDDERLMRLGGAVWLSGDGAGPDLARGDRVRVDGFLEVPEDAGFAGFLAERGLAGTLRADSLARLGPSSSPAVRLASATRETLRRSIEDLFPPDQAGLLMGLALGDTSGIPDGMTRDFRATGLTHLLAVSGQNVAMILIPVIALASWLRLRAGPRFALCAGTVVFFVILTGGEPSVLRAGVMALIALTGTVAGRPRAAWPAFGGAVLVLLLADPFLATSVGLQLSVAATSGMLALAGPMAARFALLPAPVAMAVGTTLAAQVGASPVLLAYFNWVPGTTLFANLLAFPAISPALLLGLAAAATGPVLPPVGWALARATQVPMLWLTKVADTMASAPLPSVTSGGGAAPLIGGALVFGTLVWLLRGTSRYRRLVTLAVVAALPAFVWVTALRAGTPDGLTVRFLDVGQGDAALVTSPGGATVLIDAGPDPNTVATRLAALGVRRIDLAVATHPHADHIEGFPEVLARFPVGGVLEPGCDEPSPSYMALLGALEDEGIRAEHPVAGQSLLVGDVTLEVLAPPGCYSGTDSDPNNDSIVLRVLHPDGSVLFPGDAEVESQQAMLESGLDLRADVLKVPHHGGDTSDDDFLAASGAGLAVVSVGRPNDYGHPVPSVLETLEEAGAQVVRTDEMGEVTVTFPGQGVAVSYGS